MADTKDIYQRNYGMGKYSQKGKFYFSIKPFEPYGLVYEWLYRGAAQVYFIAQVDQYTGIKNFGAISYIYGEV